MYKDRTCFCCTACGDQIFEGDQYVELNGDIYCEACIDNMSKMDVIEAAGGEVKTASEIDCYCYNIGEC